MLEIKKGEEAKDKIIDIHADGVINPYIYQWLKEQNQVFAILKYDDDIDDDQFPICYALLHKLDVDPFNEHQNPVLLDYIFTHPLYRRRGYATKLVKKLIKNNSITAFCDSDASSDLFFKCGFKILSDNMTARYP